MDNITCKIDLKLPSLNEYINACRYNRYKGAKMKSDYECAIGLFLTELPVFEKPIKIDFIWVEENKRRDLDNVAFGKKFILDALVKFGKLKDDNRKIVTGFTDSFRYDKKACVILEIHEIKED